MSEFRTERDSLGEIQVPAAAMYGPQTQRAVQNFPVSGQPMPPAFIHALGLVKAAAARANADLGLLEPAMAQAIERAATEVAGGQWDAHFPVDIFQTGSGTSSNMNANEVIAHRAAELLSAPVHPNDDVNRGQSSNDVVPTALHVAAVLEIERDLLPALGHLWKVLDRKAGEFHEVVKTGRTHLMDATPIRLGQEFGGYAAQVQHGIAHVRSVLPDLRQLAIGGTAVGTGLNTHPDFGRHVAMVLTRLSGSKFSETANHFAAQGSPDAACWASGALNGLAASMVKIANDVRLLNSGPRCGLGEVTLPALQPGSSIMPGKVNPVICESVVQVGAQVMGNHVVVTLGAQGGQLELNTMFPVITRNLLESIRLLAAAARIFADKALDGLTANEETCRGYIELSPGMATALAPLVGYDLAAKVAQKAFAERRPVREVAREMTSLTAEQISAALDPARQVGPGTGAEALWN